MTPRRMIVLLGVSRRKPKVESRRDNNTQKCYNMRNNFLVLVIFSLLLTACLGGRPVAVSYYLIEYMPAQVEAYAPDSARFGFGKPVFISAIDIHPAFATHQIAIREGTHQINYFSFNEWATRPGPSLAIITRRYINDSKWFSRIVDAPSAAIQGYSLSVSIFRMEVDRDRQRFFASMAMEVTLVNNQTGDLHSSGMLQTRRELPGKDLSLFASAVSEIYLEGLHGFLLQTATASGDE